MTTCEDCIWARATSHVVVHGWWCAGLRQYTTERCATHEPADTRPDAGAALVTAERERCARLVEQYAEHYPSDVFCGETLDGRAAGLLRHLCEVLARRLREAP